MKNQYHNQSSMVIWSLIQDLGKIITRLKKEEISTMQIQRAILHHMSDIKNKENLPRAARKIFPVQNSKQCILMSKKFHPQDMTEVGKSLFKCRGSHFVMNCKDFSARRVHEEIHSKYYKKQPEIRFPHKKKYRSSVSTSSSSCSVFHRKFPWSNISSLFSLLCVGRGIVVLIIWLCIFLTNLLSVPVISFSIVHRGSQVASVVPYLFPPLNSSSRSQNFLQYPSHSSSPPFIGPVGS